MLGLFGKKGARDAPQEEKDRYGGSGFDPTARARGQGRARSTRRRTRLAFDVIQAREATKRLEHGTRQAAYEMRAREYEMQSVGKEGAEARQTLAAGRTPRTARPSTRTSWSGGATRRTRGPARRARGGAPATASLARQEGRRRTLRYEAELREKTELKRAEAEADGARARSARRTT